jgi:UDP-GlcNAc:undecaprenyl-phosphate/decaprenyl-phosphate GlcNAc-1-phosphate transferase
MPEYLLPFLSGLMLSLMLTPVSRRLAIAIGAIDQPSERRIHIVATPRLGGPAILLALVAAAMIASRLMRFPVAAGGPDWTAYGWPAFGALMVTAIGTVDDIRPLRPATKLLVETVAAGLAVYGGYRLDLPAAWHLDLLAFPLSVFLIISVVNAVNLVDGLDGLAVGLCLIISVTLFLMCDSEGPQASILAAACGVMLGFLCYNFHPARIFLGDSGALLLGYIVAIEAISASHRRAGGLADFAPLLVLGVPMAELILTVVRRVARLIRIEEGGADARRYRLSVTARPALFCADRDHIHHRLLTRGLSHRSAVLMLYGAGATMCLAAFTLGIRAHLPRGLILMAIAVASALCARGLGYRELMPLRAGIFLPLAEVGALSGQAFWLVADLGAIVVSWAIALFMQSGSNHLLNHGGLIAPMLIGATQAATFWLSGLYRRSWRYAGLDDALAVLRAIAVVTAADAAVVIGAPALGLKPATIILDAYLLATMVLGARLSLRMLEHVFQRARGEGRRVLIYGAGRSGTVALNELRVKPALAMTAVGFLDDDLRKCGNRLRGVTVHRLSDLPDLIRAGAFDLVALSSRKISAAREQVVIDQCERAGLEVIRFEVDWSGPVARFGVEPTAQRTAEDRGISIAVAGAPQ